MWKFLLALLLIKCDRSEGFVTQIVGGVPATKGEFPWLVSIQFAGAEPVHFCGGAILNSTSIVTAAHCVTEHSITSLRVMAGAYNIQENEESQQVRRLKSISIHPNYENIPERIRHDLAILETTEDFQFTEYVQPISLPPEPEHTPTGYCWIAGWGYTSEGAFYSDILLKAMIPIVPKNDCSNIYGERFDSSSQVCAGYEGGGTDACYGDTGTPLVCDDIGYYYVAGIMSWGLRCAQPNYPGVYTEVSKYTKKHHDDKHYVDY